WNPKMRRFIFMERNGIHSIDLQQTLTRVEEAYAFMRDLAGDGGQVLFVGTKKQAQESIAEEAKRAGMHYVNQRWLGGFLTNFVTIQKRIQRLNDLVERKERGDFATMPKKDAQRLEDELVHLDRYFSGVRELKRPPNALFVVDPHREHIAVDEARRLEVPVVAMVDTNCDPDLIDVIIPANDDAIRAVKLICQKMADAIVEGRSQFDASRKEATPEDMGYAPAAAAEYEAGIGDFEKAKTLSRERGLAQAQKKSDREAREGIVEAYIHAGGKIGALVELSSETDFVARNPDFRGLAREIAMQVAAMDPKDVDELLEQAYIRDASKTVGELVTGLAATTGENVRV